MNDSELQQKMQERFAQLPKPVQNAITSADVEKRMRELADTQKLHLDQWESLENEVMLALLGFQPVEDLQKNIKSEVNVSDEVAADLAANISKIVFEPIRQELERELSHPDAKAAAVSGVEQAGSAAISAENAQQAPAVQPGTPPQPATTGEKVARAPIAEGYKPGIVSTERKNVDSDPYREPPQ